MGLTEVWGVGVGGSVSKRPAPRVMRPNGLRTATAKAAAKGRKMRTRLIRSVWTNPAKSHVGALSVVSLTDKPAATALQNQLTDDKSNGDCVQFITPPADSGVRAPGNAPTWVSMTVTGHYLVIAEVVRADGQPKDETSGAMVNDLNSVAMDHAHAMS